MIKKVLRINIWLHINAHKHVPACTAYAHKAYTNTQRKTKKIQQFTEKLFWNMTFFKMKKFHTFTITYHNKSYKFNHNKIF